MKRAKENVSFEQIRGSLGSLLLLWSRIERAARAEAAGAHDGQLPKSAYGIAAALKAWEATVRDAQNASQMRTLLATTLRNQLQYPLDIRNGVCHGLVGLSAATDNHPATLIWELNEETRCITWQELQDIFAWLSKVPSSIAMISNHSQEMIGSRFIDSLENRIWWRSEYGLELPGVI
ncbi:hypothetical protein [Thioclava nitratireducens]|uniref:hypothetical protein n=1 Tax=Thioclava nitratireducens TaxID=1915078 RepID=UPI002481712F|nr:hypothetical protein [Thioclava nitratireducens]WGT48660.1 hypothetical protein P0N61_09980 [Thioclava nitratireducens]